MRQASTGAGGELHFAFVAGAAAAFAGAGATALGLLQWLDAGPRVLAVFACALALIGAGVIAALSRRGIAGASPAARGLALAAETVSPVFLLALPGAVLTWGEDGLAFALGLGAGILLMQLLTGPQLAASGASSVPDYFSRRYGGRGAALLAALVVAASMLVLLVAQVSAAGLVSARLFGLDLKSGLAIAAFAVLVCSLLRRSAGGSLLAGAVFPVVLVAFLLPAVLLSLPWSHLPLPQLAHAQALWQVQGLEEALIDQDLADPAFMKPLLAPFISLSATNVLGIVLGIAAGTACLPPALALVRQSDGRAARWSLVWALVLAAVLLSAVPALAAYAKLGLLTLIGERTEIAQLPAWVFTYGRLGLLDICGAPARDAATAVAACAALPEPTTILHLQDLTLQPEAVALAAPEIGRLGPAVAGLLAASLLAAALVTTDGPLAALTDAARVLWRRGSGSSLPLALAVGAVVLAALLAATRPAGLLTLASWAFTLAAAGLLPALAAGLWWRGANAYGACVALGLGFTLAAFYLLGTRYFAVGFFETWEQLSGAGQTARETFAELKGAWAAAAPGAARDAAWAALDAHAQTVANWWGIKPAAVVLLTLPVGFFAVIAVSLVTRRR